MNLKKEHRIDLFKLSRGSIAEGAITDIGVVNARKMEDGKLITRSNSRVKGIDDPFISVRIIVYSESQSTKKLDRLCAKIRKAVAEYKRG